MQRQTANINPGLQPASGEREDDLDTSSNGSRPGLPFCQVAWGRNQKSDCCTQVQRRTGCEVLCQLCQSRYCSRRHAHTFFN